MGFGGHVVKLFKYKLIYSNATYIQKSEKTIAVDFSDLTQSKYTQEISQTKQNKKPAKSTNKTVWKSQ